MGMGMGKGQQGTGNLQKRESLKAGIFKTGNLEKRDSFVNAFIIEDDSINPYFC